jgi:uncharacterized membrane protein YdjX (TVP38/TMEM64 family)
LRESVGNVFQTVEETMLTMLILVACVVIIQVILTYQELQPFLKETARLKHMLNARAIGPWTYVISWIKALPKIWPAMFDGIVTLIGTFMGLTGSTYGAAAVLIGGLATSIVLKWHRHIVAKRWARELSDA